MTFRSASPDSVDRMASLIWNLTWPRPLGSASKSFRLPARPLARRQVVKNLQTANPKMGVLIVDRRRALMGWTLI